MKKCQFQIAAEIIHYSIHKRKKKTLLLYLLTPKFSSEIIHDKLKCIKLKMIFKKNINPGLNKGFSIQDVYTLFFDITYNHSSKVCSTSIDLLLTFKILFKICIIS